MHLSKVTHLSLSILLCTVLTGCVTTGTQGGGGYSSEPVTSTSALIYEVNKGKAFSDINELVIGGFKVAFITKIKGSNTTRGSFLSSSNQGRASATARLMNITPEVMQKITDLAYEDFQQQLALQGFKVRPFSSIREHSAFTAITTKNSPFRSDQPMPALNANALIFAPSGQKLRLFSSQGDGLQGFGWSSPESGFSKVAVENGVPVIDVHYVINFANFGGYSSRTTTAIDVDQLVSVVNGSQVFITKGYGGSFSQDQGNIRLQNPIASEASFASIEEEQKTSAEKAGNMVATGLAVLMGGGTRASSIFDYKASSGQYQTASLDALSKANQGLVGKMAELR